VLAPSPRLGRPGPWPCLLVLAALIWLPHVAVAAELYADGRVGQQFEYDTNIDLDSEQGDSGAGSRSRAGIVLGVRTPATDLALDGEFRLVRFPNQTQLNSEIASLIGRGRWNWRRANLGLTAGVVRDTTLEVEEVQTTRSIGANEERLTFNVSSSYDYQVKLTRSIGSAALGGVRSRRRSPYEAAWARPTSTRTRRSRSPARPGSGSITR
jgi:hypothetical protein